MAEPLAGSAPEPWSAGREVRGVVVHATARLHLGFLDLNGGLGRRFGSLGMALDGPATRIRLRGAAHSNVTGAEETRARRYLTLLETALDLPRRHALHVGAAIPPHSGLGSGTQLALAIASGLRRLHGLKPDPRGDAVLLGRGARSGIGIALFRHGGLVLDGGRGPGSLVPPMLARLRVPPAWRVVLLRDPARQGLSGAGEQAAFAGLGEMAEAEADRLCRIVLMEVLPGLAEADLCRFGAGITDIQRRVGAYFASAQGGDAYASPAVAGALECLASAGATGLGQTSWGPTGFAFAPTEAEAKRLVQGLRQQAAARGLETSIHRPLNRGALVSLAL